MDSNKSGQITVFFILGLVLLIIGGVILFVVSTIQSKQADTEFVKAVSSLGDVSDVEGYVNYCLESGLKSSLLLVGRQGGYAVPPSDSHVLFNIVHNSSLYVSGFDFISFPDYNSGTEILVPSAEKVSGDLDLLVSNYVGGCLTGLDGLSEDLSVELGTPTIDVALLDRTAVASMNLSVNLSEKDKVVSLNSFNAVVPFSYDNTFGVAQLFVESQVSHLDYLDLGKLVLLSEEYKFKFGRALLDGDVSLLSFNFGNFDNELSDDFVINFAVKHSVIQEEVE